MVKDFHKTVKRMKEENGKDNNLKTKDMLLYTLDKLDSIDKKMDHKFELIDKRFESINYRLDKTSQSFVTKKTFAAMFTLVWGALSGLLILILRLCKII